MKENRKASNKVEKLAKKKTICQVFFVIGTYFICIFFGLFGYSISIAQKTDKKLFVTYLKICTEKLPIILIIAFLLFVLIYFPLKSFNVRWTYKELEKNYSKSLVNRKFTLGVPIQVYIWKTRNGDYEEYIKSLSDIAEFYATLRKDNLIQISCKFFSDEIYRYFETTTKEEFTSYYEIAEKNV